MKNKKAGLSSTRINRIRAQGYFAYTDQEITELAWGNRFAYILCTSLVITGVATASVPLLSGMMTVAFGGVVLPNHPFDYIYNYWLRRFWKGPKLPRRSNQLKFACANATAMLAAIVYMFYSGNTMVGYLLGVFFAVMASLVSSIDLCIPSVIYNAMFKIRLSPKI